MDRYKIYQKVPSEKCTITKRTVLFPTFFRARVDAVLHRGVEDAWWSGRATTLESSVIWVGLLCGKWGGQMSAANTPPTSSQGPTSRAAPPHSKLSAKLMVRPQIYVDFCKSQNTGSPDPAFHRPAPSPT